MFDCVLPTRNARNGSLLTKDGYLSIKQAKFKQDWQPIEAGCGCFTCQHHSRAYLRHLYKANEIAAAMLNSIHNLWFMQQFLSAVRQAIKQDYFDDFKTEFINRFTYTKSARLKSAK